MQKLCQIFFKICQFDDHIHLLAAIATALQLPWIAETILALVDSYSQLLGPFALLDS